LTFDERRYWLGYRMHLWLQTYLVGAVVSGLGVCIWHRDLKSAWLGLAWPAFIVLGIGLFGFMAFGKADQWSASPVRWKRWIGIAVLFIAFALFVLSAIFGGN
jgi:hypothetical protein